MASRTITKEEITTELLRLYDTYGKVTKSIVYDHGNIGMTPINRVFGNLSSALTELNIPHQDKPSVKNKEEVVADIMKIFYEYQYVSKPLYEKHGSYNTKVITRIFGSFSNMYKELNLPQHPSGYVASDDELIEDLIRLQQEHSLVTSDIIKKFGNFSITTYMLRFGSINNAYELANLPTRASGECSHAKWVIDKFAEALREEPEYEKRFDWLKNPATNRKLPIDGYFPISNIAVEYNGPQHTEIDGRYTINQQDLEYRMNLDQLKYKLIKDHGVKLIVVDYKDTFNQEYIQKCIGA